MTLFEKWYEIDRRVLKYTTFEMICDECRDIAMEELGGHASPAVLVDYTNQLIELRIQFYKDHFAGVDDGKEETEESQAYLGSDDRVVSEG